MFEHMYIAGLHEPPVPQFPQSTNDLLNQCSPIVPMRAARSNVLTIHEPIHPHPLIQIPPRQLTTSKTIFLRHWLEKMERLDVIGPSEPTDLLSPIHLVQKTDKQHNRGHSSVYS